MSGRRMVVGAAIAAVLALGATGTVGAHWDPDGNDHAMMGPGMMDPDMMGPGMMDPGMMDREVMGPGMLGLGMGPDPHERWHD